MKGTTRGAMLYLRDQGGTADVSSLKLHGNVRNAALREGWIEEIGPLVWKLTEVGLDRLTWEDKPMAKQPKDSLRFKVLDVLNRKGTLQHREITEHLRLEPDRILTELERMKADAEIGRAHV